MNLEHLVPLYATIYIILFFFSGKKRFRDVAKSFRNCHPFDMQTVFDFCR